MIYERNYEYPDYWSNKDIISILDAFTKNIYTSDTHKKKIRIQKRILMTLEFQLGFSVMTHREFPTARN